MNTTPTLSFFGATGGCTLVSRSCAPGRIQLCRLYASFHFIWFDLMIHILTRGKKVVRNPQKLTSLLTARGIPPSTLSTHLTLVEGSISDPSAIKAALFPSDLPPPTMIISGVGGRPDFSNPLKPRFIGATVCQDTVRNILAVLREHTKPNTLGGFKPVLVCISTTGVTKERDVPLPMVPLYTWGLKIPHADKKIMEGLVFDETSRPEHERVIMDYVLIRPSFLTDGVSRPQKVRVVKGQGEGQNMAGGLTNPFVGYTICREDVGKFMFGLVEGLVYSSRDGDAAAAKGRRFLGSVVSISH
ncbi:hypothetical protein BDW66DRAFT_164902 [Aspergillus desertorum]